MAKLKKDIISELDKAKKQLSSVSKILATRRFAQGSVTINNRDFVLSSLDYNYSNDSLNNTEIEEIANDVVVSSNIRELYNDILENDKIWSKEEVRTNVISFVEKIFTETDKSYLDWDDFSRQIVTELVKYGRADFYQQYDSKNRTISNLIPLNRDFITFYEHMPATYNDSYNNLIIENKEGLAPEFLTVLNEQDAQNRNGKTRFNRQLLNLVRFKKRLVILQDLAADKAAVPAVLAMLKDSIAEGYDLEDTSSTAVSGQEAFISMIDAMSDKMAALSSGNGVAMFGVESATALSNNINPEMFTKFKSMADEELAMAIVGTAKTTQQANKGSYSSDEVGYKVAQSEKRKWVRIVQREINKVIANCVYVQFNSFDEKVPYFKFDTTIKADDKTKLEYYNAGIAVKKNDMPDFVYTEEDNNEFVKKETPEIMPFSEKKKTLNQLI